MRKKIIIVGIFKEIVELAEELDFEIKGFFDNANTGDFAKYHILARDEKAIEMQEVFKDCKLFITPDNPGTRRKLYDHYLNAGYEFTGMISKHSKVSDSSFIGNGTMIQSFVNISSECRIGSFVRLNSGCNIMHNSTIGDFSTIAPNAVILGNVIIGENCYIGANSTVLPGIKICNEVIIGAGAIVTKSIDRKGTYIGCPAKLIEK